MGNLSRRSVLRSSLAVGRGRHTGAALYRQRCGDDRGSVVGAGLRPKVQNEHVFPTGWAEIAKDGVAPQAAAEKAFKRVEEIFAKYPLG